MTPHDAKNELLKSAYLDWEKVPVVTLQLAQDMIDKAADDAYVAGMHAAVVAYEKEQEVIV